VAAQLKRPITRARSPPSLAKHETGVSLCPWT
jgi:hypothetical protein